MIRGDSIIHEFGTDYSETLRRALEDRMTRNPRYSLRALARDLGLAPSHLSGILSGKLGLSRTAAQRIADRLGLRGSERNHFQDLVEIRHARSQSARQMAAARIRRWQKLRRRHTQVLALDQFRVIADWYHFAILETARLADARMDLRWMARRLGIPTTLAQSALKRLLKLKMIERINSQWRAREETSTTPSDVPSAAIRQFHQQILAKASVALETQSVDDREFRSSLMAIRNSKLPEAKAMLQKFFEEFCEVIGGEQANGFGDQDEIYALSAQFFRISEPRREK